jgi:7,8-dihydropterin-6-yl-methyl-4-(beta-D-ribofuranosyl)aminobenzene 5'-phosphate synthase
MKSKPSVLCLVAALTLLPIGRAATNLQSAAHTATKEGRITILYDAFGKPSTMEKDWGFAALIEYSGERILFDTGDNPDILAKNAKAKGADLSKLDFVVMSHRHGDHMGGLDYLLSINPKVKIYVPKENFGVYGFSLPSSFYRKDETLPPEQRYYDGTPPEEMKFGSAWPRANFELIEKTTEIASGIHLIALVSDKPTTLELRAGRRLLPSRHRQDRRSSELNQQADPHNRRRVPSRGCQRSGNRKGRHRTARHLERGLCGAWPLHGRAHLRRAEKSVRPALRVRGAGEYDRTCPYAALDC